MKMTKYPNRIPLIYGTYITIGLILYFLIAYFGGFIHIIELRLLNFLILGAGIYAAMRQFTMTHHGVGYFRAFTIGASSTIIGVSTFVLFLFIILSLDHHLYVSVVKNGPMGVHQNIFLATFAVWYEGIFSGMMATFILVNYFHTEEPT